MLSLIKRHDTKRPIYVSIGADASCPTGGTNIALRRLSERTDLLKTKSKLILYSYHSYIWHFHIYGLIAPYLKSHLLIKLYCLNLRVKFNYFAGLDIQRDANAKLYN